MSLMRRAQLPAGFLMLLSCSPEQAGRSVALEGGSPARNESGLAAQTPVATDSPPTDGQWTMAAGDYANTRFSGLDQITTISCMPSTSPGPGPPAGPTSPSRPRRPRA